MIMSIYSTNQYNQGISRNKLLSSTSGVGSVITTKGGYYILISDVNEWKFMASAKRQISTVRDEFQPSEWYEKAKGRMKSLGLSTVDDPRFVSFLKQEKELDNLLCLIEIPHLSLNDHFNTVNVRDNPIIKQLKDNGVPATAEDFMVFGTHFPKWFRNRKGELQLYSEWRNRWLKKNIKMKFFAPPRDASDPMLGQNKQPLPPLRTKDIDGVEEFIPLYYELTQVNLSLICPNGHLSDVPWSRFLSWKSERAARMDKGDGLLSYDHCCPNPKLKWSENTTRSEGYASIYIECEHCGKKENLEGINNLAPYCQGEKPWQMDVDSNDHSIPRDPQCKDIYGGPRKMQVALVTGNNMYFANGFSSLFIPQFLIDGLDPRLAAILEAYEKKYQRYLEFAPNATKESFLVTMMTPEKLSNDGYDLNGIPNAYDTLKARFTVEGATVVIEDSHEHYRWQEYQCFLNNQHSPEGLKDLSFCDIELPSDLSPYFTKIQQIEELKICHVQLDFTRVSPVERVIRGNEVMNNTNGQNIFASDRSEVFVLPANETYGEGLFFGLNETAITEWHDQNKDVLSTKLNGLIGAYAEGSQGAGSRRKITSDGFQGAKFLLIHTFSHILMRELEFSCGYPTASLKERLFVSPRMSGVLIYTAEGSEGSMGGLVWQGRPDKIEQLLRSALERALDCSSDPLCWESDGQGLFNLNLAACFSCSLVSETTCEEWNLGLDRKVLVDAVLGFFRAFH